MCIRDSYFFAALILGIIMKVRGYRFRVDRKEAGELAILGIMFAMSSVLLFDAYNYMDVGLASTLLFVEPVFIALILWICFREKISGWTIVSIAICLGGVMLLCNPGPGANVTAIGVALVIFSSLTYAIYMVAINKSRISRLPGVTITFYSLLFGMIVFAVQTRGFTAVQPVPSGWLPWVCIAGISVIPTIVSLITVAISVQSIGPVPVAILGALEPLTALFFGVVVFGERLTPRIVLGVVLILAAVTLIIAGRSLHIPFPHLRFRRAR